MKGIGQSHRPHSLCVFIRHHIRVNKERHGHLHALSPRLPKPGFWKQKHSILEKYDPHTIGINIESRLPRGGARRSGYRPRKIWL